MLSDNTTIRVVDLFAGPGGLGEGFSSYVDGSGRRPFSLAVSIEKDPRAHRTLQLRAFKRRWPGEPPVEYSDFVAGRLTFEQLLEAYPREAEAARHECCLLELGACSVEMVRTLVVDRVGHRAPWVLIGGPPCQAYSLIGRARNKGNAEYTAEADHRQTLYIEYLQVLADHAPPVFVMENVKGLLSARLDGEGLFRRIRQDLEDPAAAIRREGRGRAMNQPRYSLRALIAPDSLFPLERATDFVVRSEDFGVPQARHRVIILGVRNDISNQPLQHLERRAAKRTVSSTLGGLPRVRSGLSKAADGPGAWRAALLAAPQRPWFRAVSSEVKAVIRKSLEDLTLPRADRGNEVILQRGDDQPPVLNHATRAHILGDLDRYLFASCFAQRYDRSPMLSDFPQSLLPNHGSARSGNGDGYFADRFRVQMASRPSSTITSHIAKDGHYYIHYDPTQCRSLTVREAARLQTFPDDYFFCGPRTSQYHQVGNAVPPLLAAQIAEIVAPLLGR